MWYIQLFRLMYFNIYLQINSLISNLNIIRVFLIIIVLNSPIIEYGYNKFYLAPNISPYLIGASTLKLRLAVVSLNFSKQWHCVAFVGEAYHQNSYILKLKCPKTLFPKKFSSIPTHSPLVHCPLLAAAGAVPLLHHPSLHVAAGRQWLRPRPVKQCVVAAGRHHGGGGAHLLCVPNVVGQPWPYYCVTNDLG